MQEVAPSVVGAYRPMGQAKHADRPSPGEYVPEGHGEQDPAFAVDEKRPAGQGAPAALEGLVAAVDAWAGAAGCTDDLTALILRAT